ncbi:hypothetical protein [Halocatena marina]|nr:hypothetical protein [Halocatena marina]
MRSGRGDGVESASMLSKNIEGADEYDDFDGLTASSIKAAIMFRRESEFSGDWAHRDRWREYYEHEADDNHDLSDERFVELREQYIDRAFETSCSTTAVENQSKAGLQQLVEEIGTDQILDALDDDAIRKYAANGDLIETDHD